MEVRGTTITQDAYSFFSLTDMWRLAGEAKTKAPRFWRVLPTTRELLAAVHVDARFSCVIGKSPEKSAIYTRKGRNAQTFAHIILALAYAEYLSPELGIEVREIALRVYAGDVTVLDDFTKNKREQLEDDHNRVTAREEVRRNNYDLNQILKYIGASATMHWSKFHDDGYLGLYEMTENQIHAHKGLKHKQAILDHMNFHELAANMYRTSLTQQYLERFKVESWLRACEVNKEMGAHVRADLKALGLAMPEDQPVVESIRECYKRLKQVEKVKIRSR